METKECDHEWVENPENPDELICGYPNCKKIQEKAEKPPEPECKPTYATPRDIEL